MGFSRRSRRRNQVLYLPLDDSRSYALDRSGYRNHGVIHGAVWVAGKFGKALSFDGVDDYVEVLYSNSINLKNAITIEGWAWLDSIASRRISGNKEGHYRWLDFLVGTGQYYWLVGHGEEWIFTELQTWALPVGEWFNLAYVVDWVNGWARVYLNGVEKSFKTFSAGAVGGNTNDLYIGSHSATSLFWRGKNDEVRIFNRALTSEEIVRLMNMRGV